MTTFYLYFLFIYPGKILEIVYNIGHGMDKNGSLCWQTLELPSSSGNDQSRIIYAFVHFLSLMVFAKMHFSKKILAGYFLGGFWVNFFALTNKYSLQTDVPSYSSVGCSVNKVLMYRRLSCYFGWRHCFEQQLFHIFGQEELQIANCS